MVTTTLPTPPPVAPALAAQRHCAVVVATAVWPRVRDLLGELQCDIEACDCHSPALDCGCSDPLCVLVDAGTPCGTESLLRRARERWPRAALIAVSPYWSEDEARLRTLASAVLHAPVRESEWAPRLRELLSRGLAQRDAYPAAAASRSCEITAS